MFMFLGCPSVRPYTLDLVNTISGEPLDGINHIWPRDSTLYEDALISFGSICPRSKVIDLWPKI